MDRARSKVCWVLDRVNKGTRDFSEEKFSHPTPKCQTSPREESDITARRVRHHSRRHPPPAVRQDHDSPPDTSPTSRPRLATRHPPPAMPATRFWMTQRRGDGGEILVFVMPLFVLWASPMFGVSLKGTWGFPSKGNHQLEG